MLEPPYPLKYKIILDEVHGNKSGTELTVENSGGAS